MENILPSPCRVSRASRRDAFIRTAICLQTWTTVMLWLTAPTSLTARLSEAGGTAASVVQTAMALLLVGALIDLSVNDWTPRWDGRLRVLIKYRHAGFMGLGATYLVSAAACVLSRPDGAWALITNYTAFGIYCFAYVFHGIFARSAALRSAESARPTQDNEFGEPDDKGLHAG